MGNNEGEVKEVELGSPSWAKLSSTHIPGIIEQVEGTYEAEVAKTEPPTDPLLLELYERRKELYQTDTKWRSMAKLGVNCCFRDVGVEPLRRMERDSIRRVMKTVEVDIQRLRSVHSEEAQQLLRRHIKNTTRDTEPIVVGSYQIRMPPMIGRGDISIPFLFLEQVYSNAIVFGFCLGRAEKRCQLENSLLPAAALATFDEGEGGGGGGGPHYHQQVNNSLESFLYADTVYKQPLSIGNQLAKAVAHEQATDLFGDTSDLVSQVRAALTAANTAQEAQQSLDSGMHSGDVPWLQMSPMGLQRFILEAAAFGRFLWEIESVLEVEYGMLSANLEAS